LETDKSQGPIPIALAAHTGPIMIIMMVIITMFREAAKECRRKKKEYVRCLENRVAVLENQNKTLIEELKSLKELYCQKDVHT